MKLNQEIKRQLISSIEKNKDEYNNIFDNYTKRLKSARNVEQIMIAKQRLLLSIIGNIPLGTSNCYFCLRHSPRLGFNGCRNCQWGEAHGKCLNCGSDYVAIQNARTALIRLITDLYYRGEKYK